MKHSDIEPAFREALGAFEALRKLGFLSDDIFFGVGGEMPGLGWQFVVRLITQDKEFVVIAGFVDDEPEKIKERWMKIAENLKAIPQDVMNRVWQESMAFRNF